MIETKTASAARLKIVDPALIPSLSTSTENVIVATPLGPNQDMKARVAVSVRVPASAVNTATGRATTSVTTTTATPAQPDPNSPWKVSSEPKTTKIASLTISTMSAACRSK